MILADFYHFALSGAPKNRVHFASFCSNAMFAQLTTEVSYANVRILSNAPEIEAFIRENDSRLKTKE